MTKEDLLKTLRMNFRTYTMIFALLFIWVLFGLLTEGVFFSPGNLSNLFRQMTIISFLAIGMVLVIVTGNIDLSVGSVAGFVSVVVAYFQVKMFSTLLPTLFPGFSQPTLGIISTSIVVLIALGVGLVIGIWHGVLIGYLGIPSFIVTLGGMMIFRGTILHVTLGETIVPIEESLRLVAQGYLPNMVGILLAVIVIVGIFWSILWNRKKQREYGFALKPFYLDLLKAGFFSGIVLVYVLIMNQYRGFQNPVLLMAIVAFLFSYLATNTRFGRYSYAVGGNKEATRLSGINVKAMVFKVFVLMGLLCGVAGIVLTSRIGGGSTTGGEGYELSAIASCVIGGTSLMGGEGTILGALIGSLVMASLENGMSVMNVNPWWQYYIRGLVLIVAVYVDVASKKGR
jgi:D-xylose transport system permease protein